MATEDRENLKKWIISSIDEKKSLLSFKPEPENDSEFNINLSRFGFRNPNDLEHFLTSPTGKVVETEIATKEARQEENLKEIRHAIQEQENKKSTLKIYLLLWLISKKAEAENKLREFIQEYNTKAIEIAANESQKDSAKDEAKTESEEALNLFDLEINQANKELNDLEEYALKLDTQIMDLEQQITQFENKEKKYSASLDEFEQKASSYYELEPEELDKLIKKMEEEVAAKTELVMAALDNDDEAKARSIQTDQVALSLQLEGLYDLRSIQKDKRIIKKDDEFYLIERATDFNSLSDADKKTAAIEFKKQQPKLLAIKTLVEESLGLEKKFHESQHIDLHEKKAKNANEKIMLKNQIDLMQTTRETISPSNSYRMTIPTGSPKELTLDQIQAPASLKTYAKKFLESISRKPGLSLDDIFDDIDKSTTNKDTKELKDYFKKALEMLGLGTIPSYAPLPETTMQSLLQNMARFGADPYKPSVTSLTTPMDTPEEKIIHSNSPNP